MATVPASTLTLPVREQIKDKLAAAVGAISTNAGDQITVVEVYRHHNSLQHAPTFPGVIIVDRGDRETRLIQGVYEGRMLLELRTIIHDNDRELRRQEMAQLAADCSRAAMSSERPPYGVWDGLAVQTMIQSADPHTNDAQDPYGLVFLMVEILYRVQQNNPYMVAFL